MKQLEADIIAKGIRNLECDLSMKQSCINFICKEMLKVDQFFNERRFITLASQELPPDFYARWGYENGDKKYENGKW